VNIRLRFLTPVIVEREKRKDRRGGKRRRYFPSPLLYAFGVGTFGKKRKSQKKRGGRIT